MLRVSELPSGIGGAGVPTFAPAGNAAVLTVPQATQSIVSKQTAPPPASIEVPKFPSKSRPGTETSPTRIVRWVCPFGAFDGKVDVATGTTAPLIE